MERKCCEVCGLVERLGPFAEAGKILLTIGEIPISTSSIWRPYAVIARPLVPGVLKSLDVLEGAEVKAGETVIGVVESAELLAARGRAKALVALRESEVKTARTELEVAEGLLSQKGAVRLADGEGRNRARAAEERLSVAKHSIAQVRAELHARRAELEGQERLQQAGGTYAVALARARAALAAAEAALASKEAEARAAEAESAEARERAVIAAEEASTRDSTVLSLLAATISMARVICLMLVILLIRCLISIVLSIP